jgi:hypothetical protein
MKERSAAGCAIMYCELPILTIVFYFVLQRVLSASALRSGRAVPLAK